MNPRVQAVKPNADYTLTLTFTNGEVKAFDVKPYLQIGIFQELQDIGTFLLRQTVFRKYSVEKRTGFLPRYSYTWTVSLSLHPSPTERARSKGAAISFEPIAR